MERARWLLLNTSHSLAWVALATGYGSLRAFTTAFRREAKMAPTAFRRAFRRV